MNLRITVVLLCAAIATTDAARGAQPYLVTATLTGEIWRIEDVNNDGDALDIGERSLWASDFQFLTGIESSAGAVYAIDAGIAFGNNQVVRLNDTNGDGDALDIGERVTWATGLHFPGNILQDGGKGFYISEAINDTILRLADKNADGDALDDGEQLLFAEAIDGPSAMLHWFGGLLAAASESDQIVRLTDTNGDGDALDTLENLPVLSNVGLPVGLLEDGSGGFYVTSYDRDTIYRATDINGDGDYFDIGELRSFADAVYGNLVNPANMASYPGSGFLVADNGSNKVLLMRDNNGDGDALDLGEVTTFLDDIGGPLDILPLLAGVPGDYNGDGFVNAADYTVYRNRKSGIGGTTLINEAVTPGEVTIEDFNYWKANYGNPLGTGAGKSLSTASVPESASIALVCAAVLAIVATARPTRRANGRTAS